MTRGSAALAALGLIACAPPDLPDALADYRTDVEGVLGVDEAPPALEPPQLPRRRDRRLEAPDHRIGVMDFLGTLGCPLSERIAERNNALGRVMVPTRRLRHEVAVVGALEQCVPTMRDERAARFAGLAEAKRSELGIHVWNAVWLDEELERFVAGGLGQWRPDRSASSAVFDLRAAVRALDHRAPERIDPGALEAHLGALRGYPSLGPRLRALAAVDLELRRVARHVAPRGEAPCGRTQRLLAQQFRAHYPPLQLRIGRVDRETLDELEAVAALHARASAWVEAPEPMRRYAAAVLDPAASDGLWQRYRGAVRAHARAWDGLLQRCGLTPADPASVSASSG